MSEKRYPCLYCGVPFFARLFRGHLSHCRKDYEGNFAPCLYNSTHLVPLPEKEFHSRLCPDKAVFLRIEAEVSVSRAPPVEWTSFRESGAPLTPNYGPTPPRLLRPTIRPTAATTATVEETSPADVLPSASSEEECRGRLDRLLLHQTKVQAATLRQLAVKSAHELPPPTTGDPLVLSSKDVAAKTDVADDKVLLFDVDEELDLV